MSFLSPDTLAALEAQLRSALERNTQRKEIHDEGIEHPGKSIKFPLDLIVPSVQMLAIDDCDELSDWFNHNAAKIAPEWTGFTMEPTDEGVSVRYTVPQV